MVDVLFAYPMLLLSFILSLLIGSSIDALATEFIAKSSHLIVSSPTSAPIPTSFVIYPSSTNFFHDKENQERCENISLNVL